MSVHINRRRFLGSALASSAFTIVPRHVLGGRAYVPPSEKIRLAHIGMGTQGFKELGALLQHPQIEVVAVCDPNRRSEDYVEWGKHSIRRSIRNYLQDPQLFKQGKKQPLRFPDSQPTLNPRWAAWVTACQGGASSPGCFTQAASITDTVNLGTVALRAGKKVVFDSKAMQITNALEANKYLHRDYRKGWEL